MVERVDSAVKVFLWRDGEFLVIRTDAEGEDPRWGIPGGRIEYGETPREALRREVREETSLEIEDLQVCGVFDFYYRETQIVPVVFKARPVGEVELQEEVKGGEIMMEYEWVSPEEFLDMNALDSLKSEIKRIYGR